MKRNLIIALQNYLNRDIAELTIRFDSSMSEIQRGRFLKRIKQIKSLCHELDLAINEQIEKHGQTKIGLSMRSLLDANSKMIDWCTKIAEKKYPTVH